MQSASCGKRDYFNVQPRRMKHADRIVKAHRFRTEDSHHPQPTAMSCVRHGLKRTKCHLCSRGSLVGTDEEMARDWANRGKRSGIVEDLAIEFVALELMCRNTNLSTQYEVLRSRIGFNKWFVQMEMCGGHDPSKTKHLTSVLKHIYAVMVDRDISGTAGTEARTHTSISRRIVKMMIRIRERAICTMWPTRNPLGWRILGDILLRTVPVEGFQSMALHECLWNGTAWPHQLKIPGSYSDRNNVDESDIFYRTQSLASSTRLPPTVYRLEDLQPPVRTGANSGSSSQSLGLQALLQVIDHINSRCFVFRGYEEWCEMREDQRQIDEMEGICTHDDRDRERIYAPGDAWIFDIVTKNALLTASMASMQVRSRLHGVVMSRLWMEFFDPHLYLFNTELDPKFPTESQRLRATRQGDDVPCTQTMEMRLLYFIDLYAGKDGGTPRIRDLCNADRKLAYQAARAGPRPRESEDSTVVPCLDDRSATTSLAATTSSCREGDPQYIPSFPALLAAAETTAPRLGLSKSDERKHKRKLKANSASRQKHDEQIKCQKRKEEDMARKNAMVFTTHKQVFEYLCRNGFALQEGGSMNA